MEGKVASGYPSSAVMMMMKSGLLADFKVLTLTYLRGFPRQIIPPSSSTLPFGHDGGLESKRIQRCWVVEDCSFWSVLGGQDENKGPDNSREMHGNEIWGVTSVVVVGRETPSPRR